MKAAEITALKTTARSAGAEAFKAGLPCTAPDYITRGDVAACWRLGWKVEAGKAGAWPPADDPHYETRQILNDLLEWAARMGGFDSPVWERARVFRDRLFPRG
jgi:hypothetical protein